MKRRIQPDDVRRLAAWVRGLRQVTEGQVIVGDGRLTLLHGRVGSFADPVRVAGLIAATVELDHDAFAAATGRTPIRIDEAQLARWWRLVAHVSPRVGDVDRLVAAGDPAFRGFRPLDAATMLADSTARLTTLRGLVDQPSRSVDAPWLIVDRFPERVRVDVIAGRLALLGIGRADGRRIAEEAVSTTDEGVDLVRLAVRILHPTVDVSLSTEGSAVDVLELATACPTSERFAELWSALQSIDGFSNAPRMSSNVAVSNLVAAGIRGPELRALRCFDMVDRVDAYASKPGALAAILRIGRVVPLDTIDGFEFDVVFAEPKWKPLLVRWALRRAIHTADPAAANLAIDLARLLGESSPIPNSMHVWSTVRPTDGDEVRRGRDALGSEATLLDQFVHHRSLLGEPTALPKAVSRLIELSERETRERRWLEDRLADPTDCSSSERVSFTARLTRLDPANADQRLQLERQSVIKTLRKVVDELARRSLRQLLEEVYTLIARERLGLDLQPPLRPVVRDCLMLCEEFRPRSNEERSLAALVEALHHERPLPIRAADEKWLTATRASGIDVDEWRRGFAATLEFDDYTLFAAVERNADEVLRMGTYFATCLSLDGGVNAASVIANTLDVNKAVIYVRDVRGCIVGRKLIGMTSAGRLAGYRTYAYDSSGSIGEALNKALIAFAARIGATPDDRATPESLSGDLWYDDGNDPWNPQIEPSGGPSEITALGFASLVAAHDVDALRALAMGDTVAAAAAARRLRRWGQPCRALANTWDFEVTAANRRLGNELPGDNPEIWADPDQCPAGTRGVAFGRASAKSLRDGYWCTDTVAFVSLAPDTLTDLFHHTCLIDQWLNPFPEPFEAPPAAVLYRRDARALRRAVAADDRLALAFGAQVRLPEAHQRFRRLVTSDRAEYRGCAALALGRLADPADGPLLERVLRANPDSLEVAWGAHRAGVSDVRRLWDPLLVPQHERAGPLPEFLVADIDGDVPTLSDDTRADWATHAGTAHPDLIEAAVDAAQSGPLDVALDGIAYVTSLLDHYLCLTILMVTLAGRADAADLDPLRWQQAVDDWVGPDSSMVDDQLLILTGFGFPFIDAERVGRYAAQQGSVPTSPDQPLVDSFAPVSWIIVGDLLDAAGPAARATYETCAEPEQALLTACLLWDDPFASPLVSAAKRAADEATSQPSDEHDGFDGG